MASIKLKEKIHEKQNVYVYRLPYSITRQIAQNLDIDNSWQHLAAEIGYTHQQVRVFEMASRTPGQSPSHQMLSDWQAKNPTAQDLHDKLHKINRRREMQILEAWFTSESEDSNYYSPPKKNNSNDDRTPSQIQAALDNFDSNSFKPPPKGGLRKTPSCKVEEVNLNRCDTFKEKQEMGSKHLDGGLISTKPSIKKQLSKETDMEDRTLMHELGMSGAGKSMDNMAGSTKTIPNEKGQMSNGHSVKSSDMECSIALKGIHCFTYKEIAQATDGFSDKCLIGQGAYGKVFSAVLKNTKCAVKKLFSREEVSRGDKTNTSEEHIKRELATLSRYRHNNIVLLYGYMIDQPDVCLVYQLMANGSLEDRIAIKNNTSPLTWKQRLGILRGAACGLQFLHTLTDTPLIHGDIKSGNILLDSSFEAKISDLGMAEHATKGQETGLLTHITKKQVDTKQYQTRAYLPPESQRGSKMSVKGDTYSFGVVLFEVCTGEKAFDEKREGSDGKFLVDYVHEMIGDNEEKCFSMCDTHDNNISPDLFKSVFKLADTCTCRTKKGRPEMKAVFTELESIENSFNESHSQMNEVSEPVSVWNHQSMQYYTDSQGSYYTYHPGSIESQSTSQIPEPIILQMQYDQNLINKDVDLRAKQKLTEIEKYQEEFSKTKDVIVDEEKMIESHVQELETSNFESQVTENQNDKQSVVQSVEPQREEEPLQNSEQGHLEDHHEDAVSVIEPMDQIQRQLVCMKLQPDDPTVKQEFAKSRADFFARFQQQILLESSYTEDKDEYENEDNEKTLVDTVEEQNLDHEIDYTEDAGRCTSNELFSQYEENVISCENADAEENDGSAGNLDLHRQKYDNYQTIAREMSDENGKVVGELVDGSQGLYDGDMLESDSFNNELRRNSSIEMDGEENILQYQNDNINILQHAQNNLMWPLKRRPEATESECYV